MLVELNRALSELAGNHFRWQHLAGAHNLLPRALHWAAGAANQEAPFQELEGCWAAMNRPALENAVSRFIISDYRGVQVDSARLCANARRLLATCAAAVAARRALEDDQAAQWLWTWACRAAEACPQTGARPHYSWTTGASPEKLVQATYERLSSFSSSPELAASRAWTLYWLDGEVRATRWLRVPVACCLKGKGYLGELKLGLVESSLGLVESSPVLIEHPDMALWPLDRAFLDAIQAAWQGSQIAACWSFVFRETEPPGRLPLAGDSLGAAAAVGFRLLAEGRPYDASWLVIAGVEGEMLTPAGQIQEKLEAAARHGIRRVLVAFGTHLPAGQDAVVRPAATVAEACRFASELPAQLARYSESLIQRPDEQVPGYLGGRKPSELYVPPDVLVRVRRRVPELQPEGALGARLDRNSTARLTEESLEVGEQYPYGFRIEDSDERRAWERVRQTLGSGSPRAAVVLGPPGQGKTQLVWMTAREMAREAKAALEEEGQGIDTVPLPIVLRCQTVASSPLLQAGGNPEVAVRSLLQDSLRSSGCPEEAARYVAEHSHEGRCWLFLDALDEVSDSTALSLFWSVLGQWQCRVVLTSRPYAYRGALPFEVLECRLAPLSRRQSRSLIQNWYGDGSEQGRRLEEMTRDGAPLAQISQNPLLLTLLCWTAERRIVPLDVSRTQLYRWMVQDFLGLKPDGSVNQVRSEQLLPLVRETALRWFEQNKGKSALRQSQLRDWFSSSPHRPLPECVQAAQAVNLSPAAWADSLIDELRRRRFLASFEQQEAAYVFPHRSVLEFLAAAELAQQWTRRKTRDFVDRKAWDSDWESVLVFLAGLLGKEANDMVRRLADPRRDDVLRHRLALAAQCLAEVAKPDRDPQLEDGITEEVLESVIQTQEAIDQFEHFQRAWLAAARLNGRVKGKRLLQRLAEGELPIGVEQRLSLVAKLGSVGAALVPALLRLLQDSADEEVQRAAARALGSLGEAAATHPEVIPVLCGFLQDPNPLRRGPAALALGLLGEAGAQHPAVIPALLKGVEDPDQDVGCLCAEALGRLGEAAGKHPGVIPALLKGLQNSYPLVQSECSVALGQLGQAAAGHPEVISALLRGLEARENSVRCVCALTLGSIGEPAGQHPAVIPSLLRGLKDPDSWMQSACSAALCYMGEVAGQHPAVIPALLNLLGDRDSKKRSIGARVLGRLGKAATGHPEVIPVLLQGFNDPEEDVRHACAWAVRHLGEAAAGYPGVIPALLKGLEDERLRMACVDALGSLGEAAAGHPGVVRALLEGLRCGAGLLPRACVKALGSLGQPAARHPGVIPALLKEGLWRRPAVKLQRDSAEALGQFGEAAVMDALRRSPEDVRTLLLPIADRLGLRLFRTRRNQCRVIRRVAELAN